MGYETVADALRLIHRMGGNALQISMGDPSERSLCTIDDKDARTTLKIRKKHGFYVVVHGKYLYNFCRKERVTWQINLLCRELQQAEKLQADVVIHQGKNMAELNQTKTEAHRVYADNIAQVLTQYTGPSRLLLENSARQGTECGYSLMDLVEIYTMIPVELHSRIEFCIDLCHIFVAGELDVRSSAKVSVWFAKFKKLIGKHPALIHFNDSAIKLNGANDKHGAIGKGYIGDTTLSGDTAGMKWVARYCALHSIPMILETPCRDIGAEISLVSGWARV